MADIGEQEGKDRAQRARTTPGQAQGQVIHRLQEFIRLAVDLGQLVLDEEDMPEGIDARMGGRKPGAPHPLDELAQGVALDGWKAARDGLIIGCAAGIQPVDGVHQRLAVAIYRDDHRPLGGAGNRLDRLRWDTREAHGTAGRLADRPPPLVRVLLYPAARQKTGAGGFVGAGDHATGSINHPYLWPACAEVDGKDIFTGH